MGHRLFSLYRGTSAWTRETEHFLSNPWACSPVGITEPDTALLTHETNTCKLFKNISIKLPGWLRAAPSTQPVRPPPPPHIPLWELLGEGKISSRGSFTLSQGTIQFVGQDFKQAAGCLEVLGMDQPLAGH